MHLASDPSTPITTPGKKYEKGQEVLKQCFSYLDINNGILISNSNPDAWRGSIMFSADNGSTYDAPGVCINCAGGSNAEDTAVASDLDTWDVTIAQCLDGKPCQVKWLPDVYVELWDDQVSCFDIPGLSHIESADECSAAAKYTKERYDHVSKDSCPAGTFVYHNGSHCCRVNRDKSGNPLTYTSDGCEDNNHIGCPAGAIDHNCHDRADITAFELPDGSPYTYPYGCSRSTGEQHGAEDNFLWFNKATKKENGKGLVRAKQSQTHDDFFAICKIITPERQLGLAASTGNPSLSFAAFDFAEVNKYLTVTSFADDSVSTARQSLLFYAVVRFLPLIWTGVILLVILCKARKHVSRRILFIVLLFTAGFLGLQRASIDYHWSVTVIILFICCIVLLIITLLDMATQHVTKCVKCLSDCWKRNISNKDADKKRESLTTWADGKEQRRNALFQYGTLILVPLVVFNTTVLDSSQYFQLTNEHIILPCTRLLNTELWEDPTSYQTALTNAERTESLKIRHEGICQAVADGYDCFVHGQTTKDNSRKLAAEKHRLGCSADGFVDLKTCKKPQAVECFKMNSQTPIQWLDGFGIATGIVYLLLAIFDQLDSWFRIGKRESDQTEVKRRTIRAWRLWLGSWWGKSCLIGFLFVFALPWLYLRQEEGGLTWDDVLVDALLPLIVIMLWIWSCADHVGSYDSGSCRFQILKTLFEEYGEGDGDSFEEKYWTPRSTKRLLDYVKESESFPDRDAIVQLEGYSLQHKIINNAKDWSESWASAFATLEEYENNNTSHDTNTILDMFPEQNFRTRRQLEIQLKERKDVKDMFDAIDQLKDEDGKISLDEFKLKFEDEDGNFKRQLEQAGVYVYTTKDPEKIFEQVDSDNNGAITLEEFKDTLLYGRYEGKRTLDGLNRRILTFVCAVKLMPAANDAYRNPKSKIPSGSFTFGQVWDGTWDKMVTDNARHEGHIPDSSHSKVT